MPEHDLTDALTALGDDQDPGTVGIQNIPPAAPFNPAVSMRNTPGTRRSSEATRALAQQDGFDTFADAIAPITQSVSRMVEDEGWRGLLFGTRVEGTDYDRLEAEKRLPFTFNKAQAQSALAEPTLESHVRAVARINDDIARGVRLSQQSSGSQLGIFASAFLDADLPLIMMSGAAFGAAKLTRNTMRMGQRVGLTPRAASRLTSAAVGTSGGFQAGAIISVGDQLGRDGSEWGDLAAIMMMSTVAGGTLGGVLNFNKRLNAKAAEKEFFKRVAEDHPSGTVDINVEAMLDNADGKDVLVIGGETPQSLGAAATGTGGRPKRVLDDPAGPIGTHEADWIDHADRWRHDSNFLDSKAANADAWWAAVATSNLGGFTTHNFHDLYKSPAAMANWIAGTIFESPSGLGRGRATASVTMEMYHSRIQQHIAGKVENTINTWARETGNTWKNTGYFVSNNGKRAFSRELMLEMSDRSLGKPSNRHRSIREAADMYDRAGIEAHDIARGRGSQRSLDGFERKTGAEARSGYNPYRWDGFAINKMMREGVTQPEIVSALAEGYRRAGMDTAKDAEAVAQAVVNRARQGDFGFDASVGTLLSGDGRQFLREALSDSGMAEIEIKNLMKRLMGEAEEAGKESFAKRRNELDLSVRIKTKNGQEFQLVDLLEQDMHKTWQRYARQMSGSAALARQGITNRQQRKHVIAALQAEQRALGVDASHSDLINAMFSHFDAGPVWGFSGGATNKGIGRVTATAKRLANISLLEQLGITQLGELGAVIAMQGPANFYRHGIAPWFNKELRAADKKLLDDMRYIVGETGMDHRQYAEWLDLDDVGKAETRTLVEKLQQNVSDWTSNASYIQNYLNLFNQVRSYQQKVALAGMVNKVFRELKFNGGPTGPFLQRATRDLGLDVDILHQLQDMLEDPKMMTWSADGKYVESFNFQNWDPDLADAFGAALVRNKNQVVQKSMAGEQDAWMHTGWGSIMTHLITFPMAAFQKQFLRHASHLDMQSFNALSFGMLTALIAVNIKDAASGRNDDMEGRAIRAFNYNNITSWIPMIIDPAATVMGRDDWRINQFGPHESIIPPALTQLDKMRRSPGAAINAVTGNMDYYDRQALKALPFATTYFMQRMYERQKDDTSSLRAILANPDVAAAIAKADE